MATERIEKAPQMEEGRELLTLETLAKPKDYITVNGVGYALLYFDDFGLRQQAEGKQVMDTVIKLLNNKGSDKQYDLALTSLKKLISLILPDMPKEIQAQLSENQMLRIASAFFLEKASKEKSALKEISDQLI